SGPANCPLSSVRRNPILVRSPRSGFDRPGVEMKRAPLGILMCALLGVGCAQSAAPPTPIDAPSSGGAGGSSGNGGTSGTGGTGGTGGIIDAAADALACNMDAGQRACNNTCVAGDCCTASDCPAPQNGNSTCSGTHVCGILCNTDYRPCNGQCI